MTKPINSGRKTLFFVGLSFALFTLLVGTSIGILISQATHKDNESFLEIPVHAESAVYGEDGFVLGSTLLEDDLDAFFFFDGLTGELKVLAINPRTHKFMAEFSRKIVDDFKLEKEVKNPRFMVVTGLADLIEREANLRWGQSVFYVLERNSGKAACYGLRFPPNLRSTEGLYRGTLIGLDTAKLRKARIRDKN